MLCYVILHLIAMSKKFLISCFQSAYCIQNFWGPKFVFKAIGLDCKTKAYLNKI